MQNFKLIVELLEKREKKQLVLVLFVLLVMGFIELLGVGSIGPFIAIISNAALIHSNAYLQKAYVFFNFSSDAYFIIAFGIAVVAIIALSNFSLAVIHYMIYIYTGNRNHSLAMRLLEKYLRQPYVFFLNTSVNVISANIGSEVGGFVNNILLNLLNLISNVIIALAIIVLLVLVNPILALTVSVLFSFIYIIIFYTVRKFLDRKGKERYNYNILKGKYVGEAFYGIKDVKILGKEKVFMKLYKEPSKRMARVNAVSETIGELPKFFLEIIAFGSIVGIVIVMISLGKPLDEFLPSLTIYAFGAYRLLPSLQKIYRCFTGLRYNRATLDRIHSALIGLPDGDPLPEDAPRMDFRKNIKLENIVFSYPNSEKNIIKNQNLLIKANTSIALIGATGCGKTTLIDIVLGLLEPQEGKLFVDGIEINVENRKNWQKNIGYVPQSIYLIDDTIRNNIAFGIDPEKIDDDAVINAANIASIHHFVSTELEKGYDTIIGERGIRLSGGQRQRIGIARAVYHNPSVLILDEATSALDGLTESAIMDAIKTLGHKKTIIMIAHRITTVKSCDIIYMMEKGIIVDSGNYEELYQKNETFRKMADGG
jgi:ABC-type multidrug transport system fused ATPase/permease subunit